VKVGVAIADVVTALHASTAILAALHRRDHMGEGAHIDLALADCALAAQVNLAQAFLVSGKVPPRQGNAHLQIVPYQVFHASDGPLVLAVGNDDQWRRLCEVCGWGDLGQDPRWNSNRDRVTQRDTLVPMLAERLRGKNIETWSALFEKAQIPWAPVRTYDHVFSDAQTAARQMRITVKDPRGGSVDLIGSPYKMAGVDCAHWTMPPRLGEHGGEILKDWGVTS